MVLHEQTDRGRTIIEKFEQHADVGFAVVLITPDEIGHPRNDPAAARPRARQNVILGLGYFLPMDDHGAWRTRLAKEMKDAGLAVDLNHL